MEHIKKKRKKGELAREILIGVAIAGAMVIACNNPRFAQKLPGILIKMIMKKIKKIRGESPIRPYYNAFYYLRKEELLEFDYRNGQLYISLSNEGKKRAGRYQIDKMKIKQPKQWDQKWRILIFDIAHQHKIKREALRGKFKQLNLFPLQKSVWVYPYDMTKEINLLRHFFGITNHELMVIIADKIEADEEILKYFNLSHPNGNKS